MTLPPFFCGGKLFFWFRYGPYQYLLLLVFLQAFSALKFRICLDLPIFLPCFQA